MSFNTQFPHTYPHFVTILKAIFRDKPFDHTQDKQKPPRVMRWLPPKGGKKIIPEMEKGDTDGAKP